MSSGSIASVRNADAYLPLVVLAKYAGLSVRTLRKYLAHASRPLPHYRVGGKVLVKRSEFDDWIRTFRADEPPRHDALIAELLRDL